LLARIGLLGGWQHDSMRLKEAVCAAAVCLGHVALVAAAWRLQPSIDRARLEPRESVVPLVAYFYESARSSSDTPLQSIVTAESWEASIELEPPPDITAVVADSIEQSRAARSPHDYQELVRLQGLYRGQLFARLQRVLQELGPLDESAATPCIVNVVQREDGSVVDVLDELCGYAPRSLQLLRQALLQSSPLPRPPQGLAMGTYLSLDMAEYLKPVTHGGPTEPLR
jgi:hypothetical protein